MKSCSDKHSLPLYADLDNKYNVNYGSVNSNSTHPTPEHLLGICLFFFI